MLVLALSYVLYFVVVVVAALSFTWAESIFKIALGSSTQCCYCKEVGRESDTELKACLSFDQSILHLVTK